MPEIITCVTIGVVSYIGGFISGWLASPIVHKGFSIKGGFYYDDKGRTFRWHLSVNV
jgi:hypothetical protein